MNSEKWREVSIPRQMILDLVESYLYSVGEKNLRGMSKREVTAIDIPSLLEGEMTTIKIKLKEIKPADQSGKQIKHAKMASKPQEEN